MRGEDVRLAEKLRQLIRGEVLIDRQRLRAYSRDQSIYQIVPRVVVLPEDTSAIIRLVKFAAQEGIPLTARGGGSGTAGAALGSGIVMVLPRNTFWGEIGALTVEEEVARIRVGAGVLHNRLQQQLRQQGYFLPADVSSANISCIGGNIATKASGPHALRYGSIDRFLEQVEFVTAQGELVNTADERTIPERLRQGLAELTERLAADSKAREKFALRQSLKTASGYNLPALLETAAPGVRLARLLAGSVGSLGLVTAAVLRAEVYQPERAAVLLFFARLAEATRAVTALRELDIAAIELISRETVRLLRQKTELPAELEVDAHLLLVELSGADCAEEIRNIQSFLQNKNVRLLQPPVIAKKQAEIDQLWELRKRILWLISHPQPHLRALAVVNDVGVPPERLAEFIEEVERVFAQRRLDVLIYGHAGNGNLHLRPLFDLTQPDLAGRIRELAEAVYGVVLRHGGTVTAEHGMGPLRAPFLRREWGELLYGYLREVKLIFDPDDLLNPGVMFSDRPISERLREDLFVQ